uniref:Aminotransferase-like plant mobile domain-containing protein n=1 Tax=Solanum lycopersicum TaxID=4081 RepID=A0A3Q7I5H8_SOLLC
MDFSDRDAPYPCLEIVENKQHARAKFLALKVHPPVIGAFPIIRKMLDTSHHLPEWSSTETEDVPDNFSFKVTTEKVLLLRSSTHQNVVVVIPPRRNEYLSSRRVPSSGFGEFRYTSGYWEWAFCENWRPSNNTVSTFVRELSVSLWDLRAIGSLPVHGSFYDEVVPSAKELTHVDDQGKSFLPRSCSFLFSAFYRLTKGAIDEVSFGEWTKFWKADCIRASVFKVASLMSHGEIFSLAVPILASIYHGLKDISTYSNLGACNTFVPLHFIYGWIGEYFETYFDVTRPQRGVRLWNISGERMVKYFDLVNARNFVTLRLDDELIVEPYSPHRFSRQIFGNCQDVPGALIEHHYDGSLLALVQLWDSCVHLGCSSKIIIPMRLSKKGSLMTREQLQEKLPQFLKSKATPDIPPQSVRVVSKSKSSKSKTTHVGNGVEGPLQTPKAANLTYKEVIDVTLKRKKPSSSSDKGVAKSLGIAPSYRSTSKMSISIQDIDISTSAASSSNESNVSQELHW